MKTILLGMSGGVDSSVAALLLKKQGYKVIGAFMKNFSDTKNPLSGECSYLEDKRMAQKISTLLKIPLIIIDSEKEYKAKVINPMFKAYSKNLTPNPDTLCNKIIKFPLLWKKAKSLKADFIATGHYARIKKTPKGFSLLSGKDKTKDQSYFLYQLSQEDLSHTLFPIGGLTKSQVRNIAKKNKFPNWNRHGTAGVCFVGNIDFKSFLKKKIKEKPGKVFSPEGNIVGSHPGAMFFTIGERVRPKNGIIISDAYRNSHGEKLYISSKKGNILVIAPQNHQSLKKDRITIKNLHLINPNLRLNGNIKARIRHLSKLESGTLKRIKGKLTFILKKPLEGIAEGQAIVLYQGSKVLGGGDIRVNYPTASYRASGKKKQLLSA